mmetsp:Transcript_39947/g.115120  ORF Transcript_39947/g.115120 Transcript_39947/m.115120 type:complete len:211 (+) Transcript_39947:70-702(+)
MGLRTSAHCPSWLVLPGPVLAPLVVVASVLHSLQALVVVHHSFGLGLLLAAALGLQGCEHGRAGGGGAGVLGLLRELRLAPHLLVEDLLGQGVVHLLLFIKRYALVLCLQELPIAAELPVLLLAHAVLHVRHMPLLLLRFTLGPSLAPVAVDVCKLFVVGSLFELVHPPLLALGMLAIRADLASRDRLLVKPVVHVALGLLSLLLLANLL